MPHTDICKFYLAFRWKLKSFANTDKHSSFINLAWSWITYFKMVQHLLTADCRLCLHQKNQICHSFFLKKKNFINQWYSGKIKPSKLKKQLGQEKIEWGLKCLYPSPPQCWPAGPVLHQLCSEVSEAKGGITKQRGSSRDGFHLLMLISDLLRKLIKHREWWGGPGGLCSFFAILPQPHLIAPGPLPDQSCLTVCVSCSEDGRGSNSAVRSLERDTSFVYFCIFPLLGAHTNCIVS